MVKYLFRIDDICSGTNAKIAIKLLRVFEKFKIKATWAIIPANKDLSIISKNPLGHKYSPFLSRLKKNNQVFCQHGYTHKFNEKDSEFKGDSLQTQYKKIMAGRKLLLKKEINTKVFSAPRHSYDNLTIKALIKAGFKINYDGVGFFPYFYNGIIQVPCNLWPNLMSFPYGVQTICIHPNNLTENKLKKLRKFIMENRAKIESVEKVEKLINKSPLQIPGIFAAIFKIPNLYSGFIKSDQND